MSSTSSVFLLLLLLLLFVSHLSRFKCGFGGQHSPSHSTDPGGSGGGHIESSCDGETRRDRDYHFHRMKFSEMEDEEED